MKTSLLLLSLISVQAFANDLCLSKKTEYGSRFIACDQVDWGVAPISADYQPQNNEPISAPTSEHAEYSHPKAGIKNAEFYRNYRNQNYPAGKQGIPLAQKFISAVASDPAKDSELVNWLNSTWLPSVQPKVDEKAWTGRCGVWAAWSMDPVVQAQFSKINEGILCNGVPFSKAELKEVMTAIYPEPWAPSKDFKNFYSGYPGANADDVEDANVALSKIGMLGGQGELSPADILAQAKDAKAKGKAMMLDRDPSSGEFGEVWNQPIHTVTDVSFKDQQADAWEAISSADFTPSDFTRDLAAVESEMIQNLLVGQKIDSQRLCALRKKLGETCSDLNALTMTDQAHTLNAIKKSAYQKKLAILQNGVSIVKHEIIIAYGEENQFASSKPDHDTIQSYTYTALKDSVSQKEFKSQWSPATASLSQICSDPSLAAKRNKTVLTRGFVLNNECEQGKVKNSSKANREYFAGAVPPQNIKTFTPQPTFFKSQQGQKKAYDQFMKFLSECDRFDAGSAFLKNLDDAMLDNVITPAETTALVQEYRAVNKLLDLQYIRDELTQKAQGVQGVEALKTQLK